MAHAGQHCTKAVASDSLEASATRLEVIEGPRVLDDLSTLLDELHAATATPVTARRPWLQTWLSCFCDYQPLAFVLRMENRLGAAALLAQRRRLGITEIVALGHGPSDQTRFPCRTADAAVALSRGIASHLLSRPGPWRLVVRHLPMHDPVAIALRGELPRAVLMDGEVSPTLRFGHDRGLRGYVSRNHYQQVRRMTNRMEREHLAPEFDHLHEASTVASVLPELEEVCRKRDAMMRRRSQLDDPSFGAFFRRVILEHAERGEVELTTLRLEGELAAYVLCFVDNGSYRMWNCRFAPKWAHLGPGRVANNQAVEHALTEGGCSEFDWMLGDEGYKSSMANHLEPSQDLLAWSSPTLRAILDSPRRLLLTLKGLKDRHEPLERAWNATKQASQRIRWGSQS